MGLKRWTLDGFVVTASIVDPKLTGTTYWPVLDLLHLAANGETGPLKEAITQLHSGAPPPADYSAGLHLETICADLPDAPWGDSAAPLAGRDALPQKAVGRLDPSYVRPLPTKTAGEQAVAAACKQWPPSRPDPAPRYHQLTMPVLIINGDRDLSTPVKWARELALSAPRSRLVVIAGMGHSTQGRHPEADAAVREFLLQPEVTRSGAAALIRLTALHPPRAVSLCQTINLPENQLVRESTKN